MISNLEASVLGLICEGFRYGYEMEKVIEERNMRYWTEIAFSSIYYVLKRLEKNGLITSAIERVSGRSRKVYSVTPQGNTKMKEKVMDLISNHHPVTDPFNLGIGNLDRLAHGEIIAGLYAYIESLGEREKFLSDRLAVIEHSDWPHFIKAIVTRPLAMLETERSWVVAYIEELESCHKAREGSCDTQ